VERQAALELLGLSMTADLDAVKHRFRALAHDLHPDRGGDPRAFNALQDAYRLLCRELTGEDRVERPRIARGRPSRERPEPPAMPEPPRSAPSLVPLTAAELRELAADRRRGLDEELLARLLLSRASHDRSMTPHPHRFLSHAPGTRSGRLSELLGTGATSGLSVGARSSSVRIELSGRGRRVRRLLADLDPTVLRRAAWTRHRGDAVTVAAADLGAIDRSESGARTVVAAVVELLEALAWPLELWRMDTRTR